MNSLRFIDEKSFIYLRYNWLSTSSRLNAIAATLAERCKQSRGTGKRQVNIDFSAAFNVVLTALEVSDAYKPNQWIRIVTDDEVYGGKTQRSAAHNRQVLTALEWLIGGGYLLKVDGKRQVKVDGSSKVHDLPFAYVITDKWREEITDQPISLQHEIVRNPLASYVQLRTKTKDRSVALPITQADRQHYPDLIGGSERLLEASDAIWQRVKISLGGDVLPPMQTTMTRIFNNGSFEQGGRFYCQLQNLPKKQRINLRFDDEPTIEIDYSGMHPHLLYHLQRNEFSGDPYDIEGFKREAVKVAFNTLINRDSSKHKGTAAKSLVRNLNITMVQAMSLENAIYRLHHRIAGHFNTGYGLKLQKLDSQIAYDVMTHFFMEIKRPILMIHDSAIVSVRDVEALKLCMADSYRSTVFNELQKLGHSNEEDAPLPKGLKVSSDDFNSTLTNTIYKALEGIDVNADEWSMAMKAA
jgi:hypothetical protein